MKKLSRELESGKIETPQFQQFFTTILLPHATSPGHTLVRVFSYSDTEEARHTGIFFFRCLWLTSICHMWQACGNKPHRHNPMPHTHSLRECVWQSGPFLGTPLATRQKHSVITCDLKNDRKLRYVAIRVASWKELVPHVWQLSCHTIVCGRTNY